MKNPFTEHPNSLNETYTEHCITAIKFSGWMLLASIACFIHSIFPFLFQCTASTIVKKLYAKMTIERCK